MSKVLIIGFVWPEPTSSAAGVRMMQLIHSFLDQGFEVHFATQSQDKTYAFDLNSLGITTHPIEVNNSNFDSFIIELSPDIVLFDRFIMEEQFGWRVAENCPNTLRILDTEDLHFLRKERKQQLNKSNAEESSFSEIAKREVASIYRSDLTLIISEFEIELLLNKYQVPSERLLYLPMWSEIYDSSKSFEERFHFMFIGNFMHEPNWDAVRFLKNDIWPKIRQKLPITELHIYGAYPSDKVFQLTNEKEGFIIKGRADTVNEICQQYRVMLAPLRFGAGVKGKFIDAMRNGLPSITTPLGSESMLEISSWPGFVSNNSEEIISKSIEIYLNNEYWNDLSRSALSIHNEKFTAQNWPLLFIEKVNEYKINLRQIRNRNFTGAMLMHHTVQSTKFMSKWIELKNKLI